VHLTRHSSPYRKQRRWQWTRNLELYSRQHTEHWRMVCVVQSYSLMIRQLMIWAVAGIPTDKVSGSNTSVYTGNLSTDFRSFIVQDLEQTSKYSLHGLSSLLAGRISWFFNLLGPCLTLDTACSSSLVALSLGCESLYSGDSDMVGFAHARFPEDVLT
jgi:hypothetical protein